MKSGLAYLVWIGPGRDEASSPKRTVTISNLEIMADGDNREVFSLTDVAVDPTEVLKTTLDTAKSNYESATVHMAYWEKTLGRVLPFEEVYRDSSRLGEPMEFGPTIPDAECPEGGAMCRDTWRVTYFRVMLPQDASGSSRQPKFIKMDVSVDGKTTTVAYQVSW